MNLATAVSSSTPAVRLDLVRKLAEHKPISPDLVFRRLKAIGTIGGLSIVGVAATLILLGFDVPTTEPARQLTAFGFAAATVALFSALLSASVLLWGGFVSMYITSLDSKAEAIDSLDAAEDQIAQATPTESNEELVQTVSEDVVVVATAIAEKVDAPRAAESQQLLAELRAVMERMEKLQRTLNTGEHERVFDSLRPRIVIMKQIQLRNATSVEKPSIEEVHVPLVG